jgi:hypothetical protein
MKIRTVPTTRLALFCAALIAGWFMPGDTAQAVSIRDSHELGLVQFGASSRHSDGSTYINNLIGLAPRSYERASGDYLGSGASTRDPFAIDRAVASRQAITGPAIGGVPSPGSGAVPDGGITAMLLGTALGALGMARRYLKTQ